MNKVTVTIAAVIADNVALGDAPAAFLVTLSQNGAPQASGAVVVPNSSTTDTLPTSFAVDLLNVADGTYDGAVTPIKEDGTAVAGFIPIAFTVVAPAPVEPPKLVSVPMPAGVSVTVASM